MVSNVYDFKCTSDRELALLKNYTIHIASAYLFKEKKNLKKRKKILVFRGRYISQLKKLF